MLTGCPWLILAGSGILGLFVTGTAIGATVIVGAVLLGWDCGLNERAKDHGRTGQPDFNYGATRALVSENLPFCRPAAPPTARPILMDHPSHALSLGIIPLALGQRLGVGGQEVFPAFGHCGLLWGSTGAN